MMPQENLKMAPRETQEDPRAPPADPREALESPQDGPRPPQDRAKTFSRHPKTAIYHNQKEGTEAAVCALLLPTRRWTKTEPIVPKRHPKRLLRALKTTQEAPKMPQGAPKRHKEAPREFQEAPKTRTSVDKPCRLAAVDS